MAEDREHGFRGCMCWLGSPPCAWCESLTEEEVAILDERCKLCGSGDAFNGCECQSLMACYCESFSIGHRAYYYEGIGGRKIRCPCFFRNKVEIINKMKRDREVEKSWANLKSYGPLFIIITTILDLLLKMTWGPPGI